MNFENALVALKNGKKLARDIWPQGTIVYLMSSLKIPSYRQQDEVSQKKDRTCDIIGKDTPLFVKPYFAMFTSQFTWQSGWLPNMDDILSDDWTIIKDNKA